MPIQTNLALETVFFHVPIPATPAQVRRLNAVWQRQPPRNGRIVAEHTARGLVLTVTEPVVLVTDEALKDKLALLAGAELATVNVKGVDPPVMIARPVCDVIVLIVASRCRSIELLLAAPYTTL